MRRSNVALTDKKACNLGPCQLGLGHSTLESTVRYLCVSCSANEDDIVA